MYICGCTCAIIVAHAIYRYMQCGWSYAQSFYFERKREVGGVATQETGAKNYFQRKLLFSNQFSDSGTS